MRIMLLGGRGQLGSAYQAYFSQRGQTVLAPTVDIRDAATLSVLFAAEKPDVVINLAARANIDWCEANRSEAFDINTLGADTVGACAAAAKIYLVHISTGCMQESKTAIEAHKEDDQVTPLCLYSWTKVWAEEMLNHRVRRQGLQLLVLRPRQLLSSELSPRNALVKLLSYTKFIDTPNSCTIVDDLLWVTDALMKKQVTGTYNVANPGIMSPKLIAEILKAAIKPDLSITVIPKEELNRMTKAERIDSVLNCSKLRSLGIELEPVEKRLREVVQDLAVKLASDDGQKLIAKVRQETVDKLNKVS